MRDEKSVAMDSKFVRLASFDPLEAMKPEDRQAFEMLEARLIDLGLTAPTLAELEAENPSYKSITRLMVETNKAVAIYDEKRTNLFFFHTQIIDTVVGALREAFPPPSTFRAGEAREVLGTTRKYAMPLLGYLDKQKITKRHDDVRRLVD